MQGDALSRAAGKGHNECVRMLLVGGNYILEVRHLMMSKITINCILNICNLVEICGSKNNFRVVVSVTIFSCTLTFVAVNILAVVVTVAITTHTGAPNTGCQRSAHLCRRWAPPELRAFAFGMRGRQGRPRRCAYLPRLFVKMCLSVLTGVSMRIWSLTCTLAIL